MIMIVDIFFQIWYLNAAWHCSCSKFDGDTDRSPDWQKFLGDIFWHKRSKVFETDTANTRNGGKL